jgi:hypothetical protein
LKGSLYGRRTIDPNLGYHQDRTVALKDLDLLDKKENMKIGAVYRRKLLEIIKADTKFFQNNSIIDYSLLIGIHNKGEHANDTVPLSSKRLIDAQDFSSSRDPSSPFGAGLDDSMVSNI